MKLKKSKRQKISKQVRFKTAVVLSAVILAVQAACDLWAQDTKQAEDMKTFPAQISFVYPISTQGKLTVDYCYNLSVNMLYGRVGAVDGAEFGGLVNMSGNVDGAQFAGLVNKANDVEGTQLGGLVNTAGNVDGAQFAGIVNTSSATQGGMQAAVINRTGVLHGLQLGVVNIADTIESGISIGLINIVKRGFYKEWSLTFADYQNVGLSYKLGVRKFYTIFNAGANFVEDRLWMFGIGFGNRTSLGGSIDFQPEIVSYNYFYSDFSYVHNTWNTTHLKLGFVYKLGSRLGISVAPGIYYSYDRRDRQTGYLSISPVAPVYEHESAYGRHSLGAGVSVGLIFN
ncbi:MAG: hypothetical protein LBV26_09430 [Bacteroidales bacterium]|jgi:hypothetical protein|nr:hypothetical protein [Bacteroidales bacterium]